MLNIQPGCKYCFKLLDPKDKKKVLRTFVKCSRCGSIYHTSCWQKSKICSRCNGDLAQPIKITPPKKLRTVTKTRALSIKPSVAVTSDGSRLVKKDLPEFLRQSIHYFAQVLRAFAVATFLIMIAIFIGIFTYRITQLNLITAETVMNAIFRKSLPPPLVFVGALTSGMIFSLVFYSRSHANDSKNNNGPGRFTYFLAGIITIISLDIFLLNFTIWNLANSNIDLRPYEEILYAQGATALIIILLTPLHRSLAPLTISSPEVKLPSLIRSIYGWTRFLFISLLLNLSVIYLSILGLPQSINVPNLTKVSLGFTNITITLPIVGAFVVGIAVASIVYWPPKFRQLKGNFGTLRLLLVILCIISIGFMYRILSDPEGYLNVIIIAGVAMFIAIPVQRSLS